MFRALGLGDAVAGHAGANHPLPSRTTPVASAGAQAIAPEVVRADTDLPLVVTLGVGLTELATAYLLEPGSPTAAGRRLPGAPGPPVAGSRP